LAAKVVRQDQLKAIQESIAGFLNDQVIDSKGEFHYDPHTAMEAYVEAG
jgi:hypothetical protein